MFPEHNPFFNYPSIKLLMTPAQEVRLTAAGAQHYNELHSMTTLMAGDLLGYVHEDKHGWRVLHHTKTYLGSATSKWESVEKLLGLYCAQKKAQTPS